MFRRSQNGPAVLILYSHMKKPAILALSVIVLLIAGAVWLRARPAPQTPPVQPHLPTPLAPATPTATTSPTTPPVVGTLSVTPAIISANVTTTVTFTLTITPKPTHARLFFGVGKHWFYNSRLYPFGPGGVYGTQIQYVAPSFVETDRYKVVVDFATPPTSVTSNVVTVGVWNVFTDPYYKLSMLYPPGWVATSTPEPLGIGYSDFSSKAHRSKDINLNLQTVAAFEIQIMPNMNPDSLPIDQWYNHFFAAGTANTPTNVALTTLNGLPAVQMQTGDIGTSQYFYILSPSNPTDVISLDYSLNAAQFIPQYQQMLSSLTF